MKIALAILALIFLQAEQHKTLSPAELKAEPFKAANDLGKYSYERFELPPPRNPATFTSEVKEGVYTMTFRDPDNQWRCIPLSTGFNAFMVTCYDRRFFIPKGEDAQQPAPSH